MNLRIPAILLAICLTVITATYAFASFPDTTNHTYSTAIDWIQADGLIGGYPDGTYKPDQTIIRAEFTKIVVEATVGGTKTGSNCFPDVTDQWFAPYVCTAKEYAIVGGNSDGTFTPAREVNYAEALKIVLEAYSIPLPTTTPEQWYSHYIDYASGAGLSYASSKLPHSFVSRAEMAEMIYWINNPQPDVSVTPTPTPTSCTVATDCGSTASFCDGTIVRLPTCQLGVCINSYQFDCSDNNPPGQCRVTTIQTPTGPVPGTECY